MKLLLITQKVDRNDPILGFFHKWIEELSKNFENINVICLYQGEHSLPSNVKIFSLGKEYGKSKIKYIKNFFNIIAGLYRDYDAVFVHMNQEYILLGGMFWKLIKKKVYFWRNHKDGNFLTDIAISLSDKVFCTSDSAYVAKHKKTILMPVGIDTNIFTTKSMVRSQKSRQIKILSLGRMSPIKNIDKMLEALNILDKENIDFVFDIVGDPVNKEDFDYLDMLKNKYKNLLDNNKVNFCGSVKNSEAPKIYNGYEIFINLTPSGSLDKTILEAVLCGCLPIVQNSFFKEIFDSNMMVSLDPQEIVLKIKYLHKLDYEKKQKLLSDLQKYTLENHSLDALMEKLRFYIKK